jgi:hypothetical protein
VECVRVALSRSRRYRAGVDSKWTAVEPAAVSFVHNGSIAVSQLPSDVSALRFAGGDHHDANAKQSSAGGVVMNSAGIPLSTFELDVESSESSSELRLKPTMRPEASPRVSQQRAATSMRSPSPPLSPPMGYNTWK